MVLWSKFRVDGVFGILILQRGMSLELKFLHTDGLCTTLTWIPTSLHLLKIPQWTSNRVYSLCKLVQQEEVICTGIVMKLPDSSSSRNNSSSHESPCLRYRRHLTGTQCHCHNSPRVEIDISGLSCKVMPAAVYHSGALFISCEYIYGMVLWSYIVCTLYSRFNNIKSLTMPCTV